MFFSWFEKRIDPFQPHSFEQPPENWTRFFWFYLRQVWPYFLAVLFFGLIGGILELSLFAFVGQLVDLAREADTPETFFTDHGETLIWMAAVAMIFRPLVFAFHISSVNQTINANFTNLIRWQTHRYVLRQSMAFFQNDFAGRIAQRVMTTGPSLRQAMVQIVDGLWFVTIYAVGAVVLFWGADWRLILPILIWLVLYIGCMAYFVPRLKERSAIISEARSSLMGRIVDSYTNIGTVKLFAHTQSEDEYVHSIMKDHTQKFYDFLRLMSLYEIIVFVLNGALMASACGFALWLWSQGSVSLGTVALAAGLVIRIDGMAGWIMFLMTDIFENIGTVQEGTLSIAKPITITDTSDAKPLKVTEGGIVYDGITFHYGKEGGLMQDLRLTIRPGEKVGLVGRSGAGKSTLINLLLRFHELEGGRILIDGQDISRVTQESLRANVAVVTQDTSLLHRSIYENIEYGRRNASESAIYDAARRAHAQEFIDELEDYNGRRGYEAHVGERGVKLSGGQRQRIAIARALLKDAPILVLDEATSALDSEVEAAIQEQLYSLMQGKTVIAIAHRLSTIAAMDRLVVMDAGRIVEEGSHESLLADGGIYAQLWSRQSGGFVIEGSTP